MFSATRQRYGLETSVRIKNLLEFRSKDCSGDLWDVLVFAAAKLICDLNILSNYYQRLSTLSTDQHI